MERRGGKGCDETKLGILVTGLRKAMQADLCIVISQDLLLAMATAIN